MTPRVIPCLLMRGRGLVKGVGFRDHRYVGDPMNAVHIFNGKEVDELVFLDISATAEDRLPDLYYVAQIADESYMPFAVGGGIREVEDIREILNAGAEKAVVNTAAHEEPSLIGEAAEVYGSQCIVASVDVKKTVFGSYEVMTRCGTKKTGADPVGYARRLEELGAGEILLTSIDREGTMEGYDVELTRKVAEAVDIPVIASGGAGGIGDFKAAVEAGASAVAAGSMFVFHGRRRAVLINYPDRRELEEVFS